MGHNDLSEIANRLEPISNFWSNTFHKISKIIKEIEINSDDFLSLPLFGGIFAKLCGNPNLSIFGTYSQEFKALIQNSLSKPQDFGKDTIFKKNKKNVKYIKPGPNINISSQAYTSIVASLSHFISVCTDMLLPACNAYT